jgi:hypothetical protein
MNEPLLRQAKTIERKPSGCSESVTALEQFAKQLDS